MGKTEQLSVTYDPVRASMLRGQLQRLVIHQISSSSIDFHPYRPAYSPKGVVGMFCNKAQPPTLVKEETIMSGTVQLIK